MILTLTTPTQQAADGYSALLWRLSRPSASQSDTRFAVERIQHPVSGDWALRIDDDWTQRVDAAADVDAFVAALPIPQQERDDLAVVLDAARGSVLTVAQLLPPTLAANALTDQQAQAAGWFASEA